jgi:hypothetical protein
MSKPNEQSKALLTGFTGYAFLAGAVIWLAGCGPVPLLSMLCAAYYGKRVLGALENGHKVRRR